MATAFALACCFAAGGSLVRLIRRHAPPAGLRLHSVDGDGSCLYHAVGEAVLRSGASGRARRFGWAPGAVRARAGNMRPVLASFVRAADREQPAALLRTIRGAVEPDDTVAALLARIEQRCDQAPRATCGWGQYGEIALLAALHGVCITVHSRFSGGSRELFTTRIAADGSERGILAAPCDACEIHILNTNGEHFDAMLPG
jgi:hypothetical protein